MDTKESFQIVHDDSGDIMDDSGTVFLHLDQSCPNWQERRGLIAAAPEMLAACKQAQKAFRSGGDITKGRAEYMLSEAIDKATGRAKRNAS